MNNMVRKNRTLGLSGIQTPITLLNRDGKSQHSIASCQVKAQVTGELEIDLATELTINLQDLCDNITPTFWQKRLNQIQKKCQTDYLELEISFPFFIAKKAPISEIYGMMEYNATFNSNTNEKGITSTIKIPITTLCPCSKEISNGGAHNQRAEAILTVHACDRIWLEDLIETVEESASCPVYSVLKRPDEKYVTERAFANPMFVEDVVRKIAREVSNYQKINKFSISVESFESIHKHNAYAYVDSEDLPVNI
ncbi:MAG: GTP cyclohydrolase I FolE2 [Desulfotalea sp.]